MKPITRDTEALGKVPRMEFVRQSHRVTIPHSKLCYITITLDVYAGLLFEATLYKSRDGKTCTLISVDKNKRTICLMDLLVGERQSWNGHEVSLAVVKHFDATSDQTKVRIQTRKSHSRGKLLTNNKLSVRREVRTILFDETVIPSKTEYTTLCRRFLLGYDTDLFLALLKTVCNVAGTHLINMVMPRYANKILANLGKVDNHRITALLGSVDSYSETLFHRLVTTSSHHLAHFIGRMKTWPIEDKHRLYEVAKCPDSNGRTVLHLASLKHHALIKPLAEVFGPAKFSALLLKKDLSGQTTLDYLLSDSLIQMDTEEDSSEYSHFVYLLSFLNGKDADETLLALDRKQRHILQRLFKSGFYKTGRKATAKLTRKGVVKFLTMAGEHNMRHLLPFTQRSNRDAWMHSINTLNQNDLDVILTYDGMSLFDCLLTESDTKVLETMWGKLDSYTRKKLLTKIESSDIHDVLHALETLDLSCGACEGLVSYKQKLLGELVIEMLTVPSDQNTLSAVDESGETAVHKAARKGWIRALEVMIHRCDAETICNILTTQDEDGFTAFHTAVTNDRIDAKCSKCRNTLPNNNECLRLLLNTTVAPFRFDLLAIENHNGDTVLSHAAKHWNFEAVKMILACLPARHIKDLIMKKNSKSYETVIHHADLQTLDLFMESLSARERFEILRSQDHNGDTVLHHNITRFVLLKCALQSLDVHYDRVICIQYIKNKEGHTVMDLAQNHANIRQYLSDILRERNELEVVQDQRLKDGKGQSDRMDRNGRFRERGIFPDYVEDILRRDLVKVVKLDREELYRVYANDESVNQLQCYDESNRTLTFMEGFKSSHMTATSFARAGLIKHPRGPDSVVCLWCEVLFCNFKATIDVVALHMAYAQHVCEFIKNYSRRNIPLAVRSPEDPSAGYLDLPSSSRVTSDGGSQTLDSGLESLIVTQNSSMSAAASALTFASPDSTSEEATASSPPQENIADRYIQYEKR